MATDHAELLRRAHQALVGAREVCETLSGNASPAMDTVIVEVETALESAVASTATQDLSALHDANAELVRARSKFSRFNSAHEGYAVLLEEVDELWELVRLKKENRARAAMRTEAIQVAAMALRFAADVCPVSRREVP